MTILVLGATGATGTHLTRCLLGQGHIVKVIVRSSGRLAPDIRNHQNLRAIEANVLDVMPSDMAKIVVDCDAVASCLGHTMSLKGLFGAPRRLVTDAAKRVCAAIQSNSRSTPTKYVLMNTTGCSNRDLNEEISVAQRCIIAALRVVLPPHADNEEAAEFLRVGIGQNNPHVEWSVVRPDTLLDIEEVSPYALHPSPIRSAIFDPGKTSRINVAHFMGSLIESSDLWNTWVGRMPVIYNSCE